MGGHFELCFFLDLNGKPQNVTITVESSLRKFGGGDDNGSVGGGGCSANDDGDNDDEDYSNV